MITQHVAVIFTPAGTSAASRRLSGLIQSR
jgi:hypothetical protein